MPSQRIMTRSATKRMKEEDARLKDSESKKEEEPWTPVFQNTRFSPHKAAPKPSGASLTVDGLADLLGATLSFNSSSTDNTKEEATNVTPRNANGYMPTVVSSNPRKVRFTNIEVDDDEHLGRFDSMAGDTPVRRSRRLNH